MGLTIHWSILNRKIYDFTFFDNGTIVSMPNLSHYLNDIIDTPLKAPDGEYKAILHIQEGITFFNKRDISKTNGEPISLEHDFAQESLYYQLDGQEKLPIIHISTWPLEEDSLSIEYNIHYPRYSHIMDSSIWNYFFHIQISRVKAPNEEGEYSFSIVPLDVERKNHLCWIFNAISTHYSQGLYNLVITREYADLNARLVRQSYIAGQDGHSYDVSPFLFHSEWEMEKEWEKEWEKGDKDLSEKLKWRFLLIDDHAWLSMDKKIAEDKKVSSEGPAIQLNSKLDILSKTISEMGLFVKRGMVIKVKDDDRVEFKPENDKDTFDVELWGVQTIRDAFLALKEKKFDIILLDYLLGEQHSINDVFGKDYRAHSSREYGYQFLSRLKEGPSDKNDIPRIDDGPCGKQFFMFISAFTTAVGERLRSEGLHRTEDAWYIAEGACPTNTPCLFRYYLSRIMERRLEDTGIQNLSESNIMKEAKEIYCKNEDDARSGRINAVRKRAYNAYHKILRLHHDYSLLKNDQDKTLLVNSFLANKEHMGALLEHLLQLVHLTAFGTVRQWPEIWEEYKFFTRSIDAKEEDMHIFSTDIEEYIIELKSA